NAVVIQIIPFGAELWAKPYFRLPAEDMKLRYLEYKVSLNESSLLGKYPVDSEVYRDPNAIYKKGFIGFHSVYLSNQNVTLNFRRAFGNTVVTSARTKLRLSHTHGYCGSSNKRSNLSTIAAKEF
ncbi:UNVERIFIED_CONTAM: Alpha-1,3-arabinosyltransferase XAT3, partial [Sesamum calycinum]